MTNAYPQYRDSGVEGLGRIPEHWDVPELGRMGSFFKGKGGTKQDEVEDGIPCIRYGDLYTRYQFAIRDSGAFIAEGSTSNYQALVYGDVLFAGSGETLDEIGKSAVNLIKGRAFCGGDVIGFRPSAEVDAAFMGYATDSQLAASQKAGMGRGVTIMHIYSRQLNHLRVPLPPLGEQRAIAAFLDRETARVDNLVGQQEQLLERLAEYRTAVITRTVTEGLPSAASEDASSINTTWRQLKAFCAGVAQYGLNVPAARYAESGIRLIRTSDVTDEGEVREDGAVYVPDPVVPSEYELMNGDLLLSRSGTLGRCLRYRSSIGLATFAGYLIRFRPSEGSDPKYIEYCTHARFFRQAIDAEAPSSTISNFNATRYANTLLPWWPLEVQRAIGQFLDQETHKVDELTVRAKLAVERLLEYRSALVTHAVTGKMDVRGSVAHAGVGGR